MPNSDKGRVLIIDDDKEVRYSIRRALARAGYEVEEAASGPEGLKLTPVFAPGVILLDNRMEGMSGLETLQNLRSVGGKASIVMMTAFGTTQTAIEAMKFGAFDYLTKPFEPSKLLELVDRAIKAHVERLSGGTYESRLRSEDYAEGLVGDSEPMQRVLKQIGQVTASDATVMITGESGTGKELVARCIYQHSHRARKPFIAVNCAAIPENLIESELFGHEKGSFTGATAQRVGKFELCDGGTIFLDEIGDMALPTQTKILRALQEGEIQRVGGSDTIRVNVRLIAATNKDLEAIVAAKEFREDLYYRLNVFRIRVPALRERPGDIPGIVDFHLQRMTKQKKIQPRRISDEALEVLCQYRWPGNVRELENVIFRSAVVSAGETILPNDLPPEVTAAVLPAAMKSATTLNTAPGEPAAAIDSESAEPLFDQLYALLKANDGTEMLLKTEKALIARALADHPDDPKAAAQQLGLTNAVLKSRREKYQL